MAAYGWFSTLRSSCPSAVIAAALASIGTRSAYARTEEGPDEPIRPPPRPHGKSRLVFIGTGNSSGTPRPQCIMNSRNDNAFTKRCAVSMQSMKGQPDCNRNYRGNPGLLIQYAAADGEARNIQIDAGKTYREHLLRWYPRFGVRWVDAVIITHDHADATLGMDDLRSVQQLPHSSKPGNAFAAMQETVAMPVFVPSRHMPRIRQLFPYLMPEAIAGQVVARFVAKLDWQEVDDFALFTCPGGLQVELLPVLHGSDYICAAYLFGKKDRVGYLSDLSAVPEATMAVLEKETLDLLVLDCLLEDHHPSHFGMQDVLPLVRRLRPRRTLLVGMSDMFEHHATNAKLRLLLEEEGLDVQLAYDGQHVDVDI